jgi:hypothetical protein
MDETRINACIAEMQNTINLLIQRNINLAGDLAVAVKELSQLKEQKNEVVS